MNGVTHHVNGKNVSIKNGSVYVDGELVVDGLHEMEQPVEIHWEGDLASLVTTGSVTCGNVEGNVETQGQVNCGDVGGHVNTTGAVTARTVNGSINTMGQVECGAVHGNISTMGKVITGR